MEIGPCSMYPFPQVMRIRNCAVSISSTMSSADGPASIRTPSELPHLQPTPT